MAELNSALTLADARPVTTYPRIPTRPARCKSARDQGAFLLGNCKRPPAGALPAEFLLPVRDSALSPLLMPGDEVALSTTASPTAGDVVLLGTFYGPELRQYEPAEDGGWVGRALDPDYEDVRTSEEQCWIVAVMFDVVRASELAQA